MKEIMKRIIFRHNITKIWWNNCIIIYDTKKHALNLFDIKWDEKIIFLSKQGAILHLLQLSLGSLHFCIFSFQFIKWSILFSPTSFTGIWVVGPLCFFASCLVSTSAEGRHRFEIELCPVSVLTVIIAEDVQGSSNSQFIQ